MSAEQATHIVDRLTTVQELSEEELSTVRGGIGINVEGVDATDPDTGAPLFGILPPLVSGRSKDPLKA